MIKTILCLLGIILAAPLLVLSTLAVRLPISVSGIGYLFAGVMIVAGLILAAWLPKHYSALIIAGMFMLLLIPAIRISLGRQKSEMTMITLPQGKEASWLGYIIDEQDSVIFGEALFHFVGGTSEREHENIAQALHEAYSDMRNELGIFPSPVLGTYLNLQTPNAYDVLVIEPEVNHHADVGVIFLHGFMGNVTAQCWEVAQAVGQFGAVTVCPSTEWQGRWWEPQGEQILRSTFDYLRKRGIHKIYLGGFSNGGFGISRLVSKLKSEDELSGLIFIDGISDGAAIRDLGLPVLIVQGTQDERMPALEARRIAEIIGSLGTYVEIYSDHFLIMKQPKPVQNALAGWLENHQAIK